MTRLSRRRLPALLGMLLALASTGLAHAADLTVMTSGGFTAAYDALTPGFERSTGGHVETILGPSMGETPQAIPNRLARGESADVVIVARSALDALVAKGLVVRGSERDLGLGRIAMAVKAGAPKPDIGTVDAFKATLLQARSVAYSDSASGVYISSELFKRLGIEKEMAAKSRRIPATPVGSIVAQGQAEIGFQQLSELKPVAGIDIVGLIPESLQKVTAFSAGIVTASRHQKEAAALIDYLASPAAAAAVRRSGMEPPSR